MGDVVRFNRRRKNAIAGEVAGVIRLSFQAGEIASLFGLEGPLRSAMRADLCLRGWHWNDADQAARDVVAVAHSLLGAERPDWYEGQPEYVIAAGVLIERTRCAWCHKKLPEGRPKYCSDICRAAQNAEMNRRRALSDVEAANRAARYL